MNTSGWKEYKIEDIFTVDSGNGHLNNADLEESIDGIPYITRTALNNGQSARVKTEGKERYINKGNCLTVGAEGVICFYQEKDFIKGNRVSIIRGEKINKQIGLFIATVVNFEIKGKFNYGRAVGLEQVKNLTIKLPTKDDKPDWEYMEQYMKSLEEKINIPKIKKHNIQLNIEQWEEYRLNDYFDMFAGKYYAKDSYQSGDTPLITATSINNGQSTKTDLEAKFPAGCLTIGKVDVSTFYQPKPFCASSDVTVLKPKEGIPFNKFIGVFLIPIIQLEKPKWNYGRQIRLGDCQKLVVKLPTKDGQPDWEFMENYMKAFMEV